MKMVSIFRLLLRLRLRPDSFKKCLLLVSKLSIKRLPWSRHNWLLCQLLHHHQLRTMMDTRKLSKRLRQRWLPLKLLWTRDLLRRITELLKWQKRMQICQTSVPWLISMAPFLIWVK